MADFQIMGAVPDFYSSLLRDARQQLVRMPDGTFAPAPQYAAPTTLEQIYAGITPPNDKAASWRTAQGRFIDPIWQAPQPPRIDPPSSVAEARREQAVQRSVTPGTQMAGTVQMPAGVRPASVDRAFAQMSDPRNGGRSIPALPQIAQNTIPGPAGQFANKGTDRLTPNAFGYGENGVTGRSPALSAIDAAVPLPRIRPQPPAQTPLTAFAPIPRQFPSMQKAAAVPLPRTRPEPPNPMMTMLGNAFNATPLGHIVQAATGQPISGGLLGMLFGNRQAAPQQLPAQQQRAPLAYPQVMPGDAPNTIAGVDLAFMPTSVQQSPRWREAAGL